MKLKMILLLVVFCISTSPAADAQIRSILREKAREALRNRKKKRQSVSNRKEVREVRKKSPVSRLPWRREWSRE
jgi:hypothetical protein